MNRAAVVFGLSSQGYLGWSLIHIHYVDSWTVEGVNIQVEKCVIAHRTLWPWNLFEPKDTLLARGNF